MRAPPALHERDFRYLWFAGLLSDAGDWMLLIALPIALAAGPAASLRQLNAAGPESISLRRLVFAVVVG